MKKCITLIVLMLLAFQNADSLWIIGDFYINQDYIAQNVCINRFDAVPIFNGKCYLEQKLKANDREEQKFPTVTDLQRSPAVSAKPDSVFIYSCILFIKKGVYYATGIQSEIQLYFFYLSSSQMVLVLLF